MDHFNTLTTLRLLRLENNTMEPNQNILENLNFWVTPIKYDNFETLKLSIDIIKGKQTLFNKQHMNMMINDTSIRIIDDY